MSDIQKYKERKHAEMVQKHDKLINDVKEAEHNLHKDFIPLGAGNISNELLREHQIKALLQYEEASSKLRAEAKKITDQWEKEGSVIFSEESKKQMIEEEKGSNICDFYTHREITN